MDSGNGLGTNSGHKWRFLRAGGFDQVRIDTAEDLLCLHQLDQKLWAVLACPVKGLECDERMLALIDTDGDGRIRVPELLDAVRWTCALLKNPEDLTKRSVALPLASIRDSTETGATILASARQVLADLGRSEEETITVEDVTDTARIFGKTRFNGDDIIPVEAAEDPTLQDVIRDIITCLDADTDRSGLPGVSQQRVDRFFAAAEAHDAWWKTAEDEGNGVLPLGEATPTAEAALRAVEVKVEDYFTRCRLAAFDPRAAAPLSREPATYAAIAAETLGTGVEAVASLPLAMVEAERPLPLASGVNPAWASPMDAFRRQVVAPLLGDRESLSETEWLSVQARFASFAAWKAREAGTEVARLGIARIRDILASGAHEKLDALLEQDRALASRAAAIMDVEKLVRFHRGLFLLMNNFVCLRDFYSQKEKGIFQAGTLFLDGRSCDLCIRVDDTTKHGAMAGEGNIFLAYCDCTRSEGGAKMTIAAAFTAGEAGLLFPGKNGVFYDRQGRDWDATIVKIIEHPISIRQAFWAPYRQAGKLITEQIQKFAIAKDKAVTDKAAAGIAAAPAAAAAPPAPAAAPGPPPAATAPFDVAKFAGIFAAIGLAIGAIGSAVASVVTGLLALAWWQIPLAIAGILLAISGPSMLLAYMKLRKRNLGPLLDACGWAVNTQARINIPFGTSLTSLAQLPAGAERTLNDPYAEKKSPWGFYAFLALLLGLLVFLVRQGLLQKWLLQ